MKRPPQKQDRKQPLPEELIAGLMAFVQGKFYAGHAVDFAKDRRRLLEWVILWPAEWLQERAVTVTADRYRTIVQGILIEAAAHATGDITYLPAWLRKTMQSHFAHHGDEIYEEAKSMRNLVENALLLAGKRPEAAPNVAEELTRAKRLLKATAVKKRTPKQPVKEQLGLF